MTKGTPSFGKHSKITHTPCRRCGSYSFHIKKRKCSRCGYPSAKLRKFNWGWKHPLKKNRKK